MSLFEIWILNLVIDYLLLTIDYFSLSHRDMILVFFVVDKLFEKTKPICGKAKLAQSIIWKGIMKNFILWGGEKTNPILSFRVQR